MTDVGQIERKTQDRIITLFQQQLGYRCLGNWSQRENNRNIETAILQEYLTKKGCSPELTRKAIFELTKTAAKPGDGKLYETNKAVYDLLRYGVSAKENIGENKQAIHFIDWQNPLNNDFAIAEEVTVSGQYEKRPDIVLYVNGIAVAVLELKRSTLPVGEAIRQNLDNQQDIFISHFFSTIQLIMAGTDSEGIRYGTIETPDKSYLAWKETSPIENILDKHIIQLCEKNRLLELIHDFICFDSGRKKLCRPHQYFGVKAARESLRKREGGIIWHTQGSGKSLVMVWLTQWINENIPDARVLIITDRDELDKQIENVFLGVSEEIYRTRSGKDLIEKLNAAAPRLICSLIHKFGGKKTATGGDDYDDYIDELKNSLPKNFKAKGHLIVYIDECHRSQSGKLHKAMKQILPTALFIGFTGTPLLKEDKQTTLELFGKYIHTYKFDDAVRDKVILDLLYEARDIDQDISSPEKIDQWFEAKTKGLTQYASARLKQKWGTMKSVLSSKSRLERIVNDIQLDMETKDRLQNGRGNALLVSGSIYEACKYYELFQSRGFKKCAIVTSFSPTIQYIKGQSTGEESPGHHLMKYKIYREMLKGKDPEKFQDEVKKKFIQEPAQMKLLIVVDMLLTGFDAPPATYLYIDKSMQDHGLFQAICRVNRLDGDDKEFGYIIDYKDLFLNLEKSIKDYTAGAFTRYENADILGLLSNRLQKCKERLDQALEAIHHLCEPVAPPQKPNDYFHYFCAREPGNQEQLEKNKPKRLELYKYTAALIRSHANIANEMQEAGYTPQETKKIAGEVAYYDNLRRQVQCNSGDYIDLRSYESDMRHLIDTYIDAHESRTISAFEKLTLIDLIVENGAGALTALPPGIAANEDAIAETIENNVRRLITEETPTNPKYYEKMSRLLDEIIRERKAQTRSYAEYLASIVELCRQVKNPAASFAYPKSLDTNAKRALYDNLNQDEALAVAIHKEILATKKDSWRGHIIREREVKSAVRKHIPDDDAQVERIFQLIKEQKEY
ncbi:MAG: type I restriction endonuclease subunit R [Candidatus Aminicenantes bacterium]|nr:type I restriction endonuclease subunit R [Candidatus Aminicenantes bacterium]